MAEEPKRRDLQIKDLFWGAYIAVQVEQIRNKAKPQAVQ